MTDQASVRRIAALVIGVVLGLTAGAATALAQAPLRVGKAIAGPFDFTPLDVGIEKGFYRAYDIVMPSLSDTGRFDPKALATLARSFVDMKLLETEPDMSKLYTEKFLPGEGR